jgi:hypothetical protein
MRLTVCHPSRPSLRRSRVSRKNTDGETAIVSGGLRYDVSSGGHGRLPEHPQAERHRLDYVLLAELLKQLEASTAERRQ